MSRILPTSITASPGTLVMIIFFSQALASGGLYTRIPDVQLALGLDEATLGLAIMGQPIGALCMFLVSSAIIERIGTKPIFLYGLPFLACAVTLMGNASSLPWLFISFALFGSSFALCNVAMNVEADRIEAAHAKRLLNRCHGFWSLGFLVASLIGAAARGFDVSPVAHFLSLIPVVIFATLIFTLPLQASPPRSHTGGEKKKLFVKPTGMIALLVVFGFSGVLLEGGSRNWSVIYMRDSFNAPDWIDTLTLPAFLITMTIGRLFADNWIERFGPARVATALLSTALAGLAFVIFAQTLVHAMIGFGLMGIGVCSLFPMTLSTAARIGDRPASENVSSVTMITSLVLLGAPAIMGLIANSFGIRATFIALAPMVIASLLLTRLLETRPSDTPQA